MTIRTEKISPEDLYGVEPVYPRLMVGEVTGSVYLQTDADTGILIHKGRHQHRSLGGTTKFEVGARLKPFHGAVKLSNQ